VVLSGINQVQFSLGRLAMSDEEQVLVQFLAPFDAAGFYLTCLVIASTVSAALSVWIAHQKYRRFGEGLLLGYFFGPLGIIVEGLLPVGQTPTQPPPEEADKYRNRRMNQAIQQVGTAVILGIGTFFVTIIAVELLKTDYKMRHCTEIARAVGKRLYDREMEKARADSDAERREFEGQLERLNRNYVNLLGGVSDSIARSNR